MRLCRVSVLGVCSSSPAVPRNVLPRSQSLLRAHLPSAHCSSGEDKGLMSRKVFETNGCNFIKFQNSDVYRCFNIKAFTTLI